MSGEGIVALLAVCATIAIAIAAGTWCISQKISKVCEDLARMSTEFAAFRETFRCCVEQHAEFDKRLDGHDLTLANHEQRITGLES